MLKASYVLPIKLSQAAGEELTAYLRWLRTQLEVIVVDGSEPEVFAVNAERWPFVTHVPPADDIKAANGKVRGVLTGLRIASHDRVVIADDDVRYDGESLRGVLAGLKKADVVRPQNYFQPLPWHAFWDTGRILINRATDGDWPGTLAARRTFLSSGYDGDALFENLELVRTVRAAGGKELVARDVLVRRLPPPARHFLSQRIRQAYDEFARPLRFALQLALLPAMVWLARCRPALLLPAALGAIGLAERGRRRDNGASVFPSWASLAAPLWLSERMVTSWLALGSRIALGGVRYHGRTLSRAATSQRDLAARFSGQRAAGETIARPSPAGEAEATLARGPVSAAGLDSQELAASKERARPAAPAGRAQRQTRTARPRTTVAKSTTATSKAPTKTPESANGAAPASPPRKTGAARRTHAGRNENKTTRPSQAAHAHRTTAAARKSA
jgi:hypothetical protein